MKKNKYLTLPSVLTETSWFYEKHKEELKEHLGKPYLSYSSKSSFESYKEDFIKQKFVGIKLPESIYGSFGSYCGEAVEKGEFPKENVHKFEGQENLKLDLIRPKKAEYEKLIVIDRGAYIIIGFIDIYEILKDEINITDLICNINFIF